MNIITWTGFTKRKNSTLQPASSDGTTVTARLKENTSTANPVFILQGGVSAVNYVQAFARYYFVNDVVSLSNNMHELHCSIDVLATYRSTIRSYTAFVERAASSYDAYINDPLLTGQQNVTSETVVNTPLPSFFGSGCFVTQVMARDLGVTLYITPDLTPYEKILQPSVYSSSSITEWIDSKIAQAFDLDVYIGSIKWMPFTASQIGTIDTSNHFYIGPVDVGIPISYNYYHANQNATKSHVSTLSLPSTDLFNDWRDNNPNFTRYNLRLPGVGVVDLDPAIIGSCIHNGRTIEARMDIDITSGAITHTLTIGNSNAILGRYTGNISVDVPLGKSSADTMQSLGMVGSGAASGAAAGGIPGAIIGGVVGTISAIHNELTPGASMTGGTGNKAELGATRGYYWLSRRTFGAKEYPTTVAGRPLYQNVQLSTLSGFVKCGNASVPISGYDQDKEAVNGYLNSGFYME